MHLLHFCVRVAQIHRIPDSDLGWEDMYREDEGEAWLDWVRCSSFSIHLLLLTIPSVFFRPFR